MADRTKYRIAAASSDGIVVNQHFGRADTFYIYEAGEDGEPELLETRSVLPVCHGGNHNDDSLQATIEKLKDCKYLLVSRIGAVAANRVQQEGMIPMELPGVIGESIDRLIHYIQIQKLFEEE